MKTAKYIKIFIINTASVIIISKIIPSIFKNISEHSFERIMLAYFMLFNITLLYFVIKEEKKGTQ